MCPGGVEHSARRIVALSQRAFDHERGPCRAEKIARTSGPAVGDAIRRYDERFERAEGDRSIAGAKRERDAEHRRGRC
jgi:hypothetical protein